MTFKLRVLQNWSGRDGAVLSFIHFSCHFAKTWLWVLLPVF